MISSCGCLHGMDSSWDPTALRRSLTPRQPAAARVRLGLCKHSWGTQDWHAKHKVMGLSGSDIIQHLIPLEFQLVTKLDLWDGGHKPFAAAPWTVDRTFFYQSGIGSSDSCAGASEWISRSAMISSGFFLWKKKLKSNGVWRSISCLLITNCHNWPNHQKSNFYRGDKNGVCQFSDFYRHDKKLIQKYQFLSWR